jgi:hypothetical protein
VYGNPSSTQPLTLQSDCFNLFSTKALMTASGTGSPVSKQFAMILEFSLALRISFFNRVLAEIRTRPKSLARILA